MSGGAMRWIAAPLVALGLSLAWVGPSAAEELMLQKAAKSKKNERNVIAPRFIEIGPLGLQDIKNCCPPTPTGNFPSPDPY